MYRRRHHCRMCGQIFCNSCSSFYIDGKLFNTPGLVRACKLCYDQQYERGDMEYKVARNKVLPAAEHTTTGTVGDVVQVPPRPVITTAPVAGWISGGHCKLQDSHEAVALRSSNLQSRYVLFLLCCKLKESPVALTVYSCTTTGHRCIFLP